MDVQKDVPNQEQVKRGLCGEHRSKEMCLENCAERDCSCSHLCSVLQDSSFLLEQPLEHRRLRRRSKGGPQNGNLLDLSGPVQPPEQLRKEEQLQRIIDTPDEDTPAQPEEDGPQATRKVTRRKAEVTEPQREDDSGSKRVCLGQMSRTASPSTPAAGNGESEQAAREAEEVVDVETLSLSGAEGWHEDQPEWSKIKLREAGESSDCEELEPSSGDEIIVVEGDGEDEDIDAVEGSGLVAHPMSVPWSESSLDQEEEEEIDIMS